MCYNEEMRKYDNMIKNARQRDRLETIRNDKKLEVKAQRQHAVFFCWAMAFKNGDLSKESFEEYLQKEKPEMETEVLQEIYKTYYQKGK